MKVEEIIKSLMKIRGFSNQALAEKLGYTTASGVSEKLRRSQGMRLDTLVRMAEAMDCEVVIRSKLKDKGEWKVSAVGREEK